MLDLHTHLWPHEPGTRLPSYDELGHWCERAAAAGVQQLAVTEHSHRFDEIARVARASWTRDGSPALRAAADHVWDVEGGAHLDDYVELLTTAQRRGLPLLVGLEVDHLPGANDAVAEVLTAYPFDVLLGSVHWLGSWLFDAYDTPVFAAEWDLRSVDDVWSAYVDAVDDLARSGHVDVIAHADVIKVAGRRPADLAGFEDRLGAALARSDVAVEVSSAGWRKPINEPYPSMRLLQSLRDAGVPLTTASDAHRVEQLGYRFDELYAVLARLGIDTIATFERRSRRPFRAG